MISAVPVLNLASDRLNNELSFDICCNVPTLATSISTYLQPRGFYLSGTARTKVILDVPQGYAFSVLQQVPRLPGGKPALRLVVITFNLCPEYLEDLWDLHPTVLLANPNFDSDLSHAIASAAAGISHRITSGDVTPLTSTERKVLHYLVLGGSNRYIANRLNLQEKTVMNNLTIIYNKLNLKTRTEAILYYWGLLPPICNASDLVATVGPILGVDHHYAND